MAALRAAQIPKGAKLRRELGSLYSDVVRAFEAQDERAKLIAENWDMWNCKLGMNQLYNGRNQLYAPFVHEAVKARCTRVINDIFPKAGRHVEVVSQDETLPRAALSVIEHYIDAIDLRSTISSMFLNGDMEGQYNLYISWRESTASVTYKAPKPVTLSSGVVAGEALDVMEETRASGYPHVEVLSDNDVVIYPFTASSLEDALNTGGFAAIARRWSSRQIKEAIRSGAITKEEGDALIGELQNDYENKLDRDKAYSAGVKSGAEGRWALVYEVWTELEVDGTPRLCQIFMAGRNRVLSIRRNPYWCDLCPLISVPVERVSGAVKGITPVSAVKQLQYYANDILNEGADSGNYALLPIILRDPAYQTSPVVLAPAATLDIPPNGAQFVEFPSMWQHTAEILSSIKAEIFQVLNVNPSMITGGAPRKPTQAEVAQEQVVDILTTNDLSELIARSVLDKVLTLIMSLDYQFRDNTLFVRAFGETGMQFNMEQVPPFEVNTRYVYKWIGAEATRSAQQMQEKIAALNIIKAIPPQLYSGYQLDLQPFVLDLTETVFGPRLGRQVFKDMRSQMSVDPELENELLALGHYVHVHAMDDTAKHIASHRAAVLETGDPFNTIAQHLQEHELVFMQQQQSQQAAVAGATGPGAGQQGTPVPPEPGSVPEAPTGAQRPPGAIHEDNLVDASMLPRSIQ
jgi:hypothetical protein